MVASISRSSVVSRTSSSSSIDFSPNSFNAAEQRRTRKRISAAQLACLEELYHQSSHPTREQRDALAKRIQMEMKSVTIWFQNKRQTDRKVALHNATNSRNVTASASASSDPPNITITTPTSPSYTSGASAPQGTGARFPSDGPARKISTARSSALKRVPSYASSASSASSTARTRPSLDRVASLSELRFTEKPGQLQSDGHPLARQNSQICDKKAVVPRDGSTDGPVPEGKVTIGRTTAAPLEPVSPPPSTNHPLWATMLSSPVTPSSPPPVELIAYTHARRGRNLDWACAAARLATIATLSSKFGLSTANLAMARSIVPPALSPTFPTSQRDTAAREQEYEEATAMTEDEAELITPNGSQDIPMSWEDESHDASACDTAKSMTKMGLIHFVDNSDKANTMSVDACGWEEDEVHAALALCGLRG